MAVLTEKQKRFVRALFESPKTYGAGVFAARLAGHGNEKSSRQSLASMAYQMQCDPKIQAAIAEVSQSFLTTLGPVAVRAMKKVLGNDKRRDFGRVIGIIMDRVDPPNSTHTVKVEHDATPAFKDSAQVLARITELAAKFSVKLPPTIDGELVERLEAAQ